MNPSSSEISLPPPVEQAPIPGAGGAAERRTEQAPTGAERRPQLQQAAQPAVAAIPLPVPLPTAQHTTMVNDVTSTSQGVVPSTINDTDLIEKEWINKAKQIVERTRDDPYKQSEQITEVKADYMKKRYNKAIKLSK